MENEILFYHDSNAPLSLAAKMFLDREEIPYVSLDYQDNNDYKADIISLEYEDFPVFVLPDGLSWQGFEPQQMLTLKN